MGKGEELLPDTYEVFIGVVVFQAGKTTCILLFYAVIGHAASTAAAMGMRFSKTLFT